MGLKLFTGQDRAIYRTGQSYLQDRTELFTGQDRVIYRTGQSYLQDRVTSSESKIQPRYSPPDRKTISTQYMPEPYEEKARFSPENQRGQTLLYHYWHVDIPCKTFILCCYSPLFRLLLLSLHLVTLLMCFSLVIMIASLCDNVIEVKGSDSVRTC